MPLAAKQLAQTGEFDALIAIGCVIRGETSHYDYVCSESARGLQSAQLETGIPMIFCVLTCENQEQALARAGGAHGNKGHDSGLAAIEMAQLSNKLSGKDSKSASAPARKIASSLMTSLRTKSREYAMQMLFQWDMSRQDAAKLEAKFWRSA